MMAYRDAVGLPVAQNDGYAVGERGVLLSQEIRAYLDLRRRGELTFRAWVRSWAGAMATVTAVDDPLPGLGLILSFARRRLSSVRRRLFSFSHTRSHGQPMGPALACGAP